MFYNACLCGGVEPLKAKTLYAAVYHFGPRWELRAIELGEGMPPRGPGGRRTKGGRTKGLTKGGVRPKGEMGEQWAEEEWVVAGDSIVTT